MKLENQYTKRDGQNYYEVLQEFKDYKKPLIDTPTKEKKYKISDLPWKKDRKRHSLHSLCSRICSFPPALVRYFILNYSEEGDVIFDPFCGKGTLPLEALLNNRIGWGNDLSPEAYILTKAKVSRVNPKRFFNYLDKINLRLDNIDSIQNIDPQVKIFFQNNTLKQILELRKLLNEKDDKYATFTKAILLGILHGSANNALSLRCNHAYAMSPNYVKRYAKDHRLIRPKKNVLECIKNKALTCFEDEIPKNIGKAYKSDSRKLRIKSNSCNLVVTSPPYFAVHTYARDNWLRLWFLGYNYKEISKLLLKTNSEEKYENFMYDSLQEMFRILKDGSNCFIIVGDVKKHTVNGGIINTAEFLKKPAEHAGFIVKNILIDRIPPGKKALNSYLCTKGISTERILHLVK